MNRWITKRFGWCKATRHNKEIISNTPVGVIRWCEKFRASRLQRLTWKLGKEAKKVQKKETMAEEDAAAAPIEPRPSQKAKAAPFWPEPKRRPKPQPKPKPTLKLAPKAQKKKVPLMVKLPSVQATLRKCNAPEIVTLVVQAKQVHVSTKCSLMRRIAVILEANKMAVFLHKIVWCPDWCRGL